MKNALTRALSLLAALILTTLHIFSVLVLQAGVAQADPGMGGSGGGPRVGQLVTVTVCNGGESGDICHQVTYRVRQPSKPEATKETCFFGDIEGPCPISYGVPEWLKRLNESFGAQTVPSNDQ